MGNKSIWIAGALVMFIGLLFASRVNEKNYPTKPPIISGTVLSVATGVPLQQETEVVHRFFSSIQHRQIAKAIGMMDEEMTQDEKVKKAWEDQFNAMESVEVISIDTSLLEDWTGTRHTYKVMLEIKMDPSSVNSQIPYYGYENGINIRYISLIKSGTIWKVGGIATGP